MTIWHETMLSGWGRTSSANVKLSTPASPEKATEAVMAAGQGGLITFGNGRSYGDAALNDGGYTISTEAMNRVIHFDPVSGDLECDAGITFQELTQQFLREGFIPPVCPGTGFVSIGGAVANDVHGKNHDIAGSFGNHIKWLDLLLISGEITRISATQHPELFAATLGGLGLTGIILRVCFTMLKVSSNAMKLRETRIPNLETFFDNFEEHRNKVGYSVGWIDALSGGRHFGRGVMEIADISPADFVEQTPFRFSVPFNLPSFCMNRYSVGVFNELYFHRIPLNGRTRNIHYERFVFPLDAILQWNRLYGRRGVYQFQCVLPQESSREGITKLLRTVVNNKGASFLAVIKTLGDPGQGYLSFPLRGYTLALDFPRKAGTLTLLKVLEDITLDYGGRIYLAKDASLSATSFHAMYPNIEKFRQVLERVDPENRMQSDMARRLKIR